MSDNNQQAARELLPCPRCESDPRMEVLFHRLDLDVTAARCCVCGWTVCEWMPMPYWFEGRDHYAMWNIAVERYKQEQSRPTPPDSGEK